MSNDWKGMRESAMVITGQRVLQAQKPGQRSWSTPGTRWPDRLAGGRVAREVCVEAKGIDYIGFRGHYKNLALILNEKGIHRRLSRVSCMICFTRINLAAELGTGYCEGKGDQLGDWLLLKLR